MSRFSCLLIAGVIAASGCTRSALLPPPLPPLPPGAVKTVVYKDKTFTPGRRVKLLHSPGTFKPSETSYSSDVKGDAGHTGTVLWGEKREDSPYTDPDNEPVQVLRVRWDAATWTDSDRNKPIKLDAFDAVVHAAGLDYE